MIPGPPTRLAEALAHVVVGLAEGIGEHEGAVQIIGSSSKPSARPEGPVSHFRPVAVQMAADVIGDEEIQVAIAVVVPP